MFQEHQAILQIAISAETTAVSEYNHEKEQLAMKLKEKLSTECDKIESGDLLKDYSPIKHHNEMTLIMDEYNVIEDYETVKDLGVIMNNKATFTDHIEKAVKKARQKMGWILRTFKSNRKWQSGKFHCGRAS